MLDRAGQQRFEDAVIDGYGYTAENDKLKLREIVRLVSSVLDDSRAIGVRAERIHQVYSAVPGADAITIAAHSLFPQNVRGTGVTLATPTRWQPREEARLRGLVRAYNGDEIASSNPDPALKTGEERQALRVFLAQPTGNPDDRARAVEAAAIPNIAITKAPSAPPDIGDPGAVDPSAPPARPAHRFDSRSDGFLLSRDEERMKDALVDSMRRSMGGLSSTAAWVRSGFYDTETGFDVLAKQIVYGERVLKRAVEAAGERMPAPAVRLREYSSRMMHAAMAAGTSFDKKDPLEIQNILVASAFLHKEDGADPAVSAAFGEGVAKGRISKIVDLTVTGFFNGGTGTQWKMLDSSDIREDLKVALLKQMKDNPFLLPKTAAQEKALKHAISENMGRYVKNSGWLSSARFDRGYPTAKIFDSIIAGALEDYKLDPSKTQVDAKQQMDEDKYWKKYKELKIEQARQSTPVVAGSGPDGSTLFGATMAGIIGIALIASPLAPIGLALILGAAIFGGKEMWKLGGDSKARDDAMRKAAADADLEEHEKRYADFKGPKAKDGAGAGAGAGTGAGTGTPPPAEVDPIEAKGADAMKVLLTSLLPARYGFTKNLQLLNAHQERIAAIDDLHVPTTDIKTLKTELDTAVRGCLTHGGGDDAQQDAVAKAFVRYLIKSVEAERGDEFRPRDAITAVSGANKYIQQQINNNVRAMDAARGLVPAGLAAGLGTPAGVAPGKRPAAGRVI